MRPKTAGDVVDLLVRDGWHGSVVFDNGAKYCARLNAKLIRDSAKALRARSPLPRDVRTLLEAVDLGAPDVELESEWRKATEGLRALLFVSPVGTERERNILREIAQNQGIVRAMRVVAAEGAEVDPSWVAVFSAEGSSESMQIAETHRARHPIYAKIIDRFGPGAVSAPTASGLATPPESPVRAGRSLSVSSFWALVDAAGRTPDPVLVLREWLLQLRPAQIAAFDRHFTAAVQRGYSWALWGAAYLRLGGCSDDCFRDFRGALVLRGRETFERVLSDPDLLADHPDVEPDEETLGFVGEVYEEKTGDSLPDSGALVEERGPLGERFDFANPQEMRRRYPRLFASTQQSGRD